MSRPHTPPPADMAQALRALRSRVGETQTAAAKRDGAPDFRTLSHWETARKSPSVRLLRSYLDGLGFDFRDLQEALDQAAGRAAVETLPKLVEHLQAADVGLSARLDAVERRMAALVDDPAPDADGVAEDAGGQGASESP